MNALDTLKEITNLPPSKPPARAQLNDIALVFTQLRQAAAGVRNGLASLATLEADEDEEYHVTDLPSVLLKFKDELVVAINETERDIIGTEEVPSDK